jgi:hypothetical protein
MTRPSEDLSRGPGLTPIDSTSLPSPTDRRTEPDRTTGRIPAQEDDSAKHRKLENDKKNGDRDR